MDNIDNFRERALEVAKDLEVFSDAYNVGTLRNRAEEAASRAVHDASLRIEEAMAKAELARRRADEGSEGGEETDAMKREKLVSALERGDKLQQKVNQLEETIAELRHDADEARNEKKCVEQASKQAWLEVASLKQELAELRIKKNLLEEQAAEVKTTRAKSREGSNASEDTNKSSTKSSRSWKGMFVLCRGTKVVY